MARSLFLQAVSICFALFFSLSLSAPSGALEGTTGFSKRASALDDLWRSIPNTQKAGGDSALYFKIDQSKTDAWGITFLYGCTALMISDPEHVVVAHMQEINSQACLSLSDTPTVEKFISDKLEPATDFFDPGPNTRVELIYSSQQSGTPRLDLFINFLTDTWGLDESSIRRWAMAGGSGTGDAPGSPQGKAVIQWVAGNGQPKGTLKVFLGSSPSQENPIREDNF
ncbi:hypothetical protein K505DRAFT_334554 [Melanomma pulvis-pyrius CBS 109.77]|uniref:Uncharacterized protein n=1 Tax=Melanomma pulvis-pyrius CBS 109.77 TaxID=1314802 RepID=A0A6A6XLU6_9PLEO|nr:hypothetical protein K505DRAFT_334554 [Melanomma pulvis-pyrius CBS 109.77]